jgi:hypothetical protein
MKKKNTTNKKLASAASMLLLSTAMLGMATYAWFTMNKEVSVTGMKVQAKASEGLVISGDAKANWLTDWDVRMSSGVKIYPTNTDGNPANWAVAYSKDFNDEDSEQAAAGYNDLTMSYTTSGTTGDKFGSGEGIGQATLNNNTQDYLLKKIFYIKSTGDDPLAKSLIVKEVTATVDTTTGSGSGDLNKALRVLVVAGNDRFIYAPVTGYDSSIKYKGAGDALTLIASSTPSTASSINPIGNTDGTAAEVDVYIYYEGEDDNCKSANITGITVDTLDVGIKFGYTE